ncbi:hypothetical protein ACJMK2_001733 [Sinanodonta woodiana]|uniref:Uncharacterized protein n=1 Tax=Sinanodonta woodiana TaxID=1069815 RepID=A0ABD3XT30_SINWO
MSWKLILVLDILCWNCQSSGIVKEYTLDERSLRREEELPASGDEAGLIINNEETSESSRKSGRRRSMLQTKGDKSNYYGNTATVDEDTGQYSIDLNDCVAAALNTAVTGVMREMSRATQTIEILLQRMTTKTGTSRYVIPAAVASRDNLTQTWRHDRASTSALARMARVIGTAGEGRLSLSDRSESEEGKYRYEKWDKGNELYSDRNIKKMARRAARNEVGSSENEETNLSGDESEMKQRVYRVPIKIGSHKNQNIAQSSENKGNTNKEVKSGKPNVETPNDNKNYQKLVEKIEKMDENMKFTNQGKCTKYEQSYAYCPLRIKKTRMQTHVPETKNETSEYPQTPSGGARN